MKASGTRKQRGAYFTPAWLADMLVEWAVRSPSDVVVDPSAGRGDLLLPAALRLAKLGRVDPRGVYGVELHEATVRALRTRLNGHARITQLIHSDFFAVSAALPLCHVVLANPPYVRHQEIPLRGLKVMRRALGDSAHKIGGRASAWAYFLVHASCLLRESGRLAFVLPSEILTSDYATNVLEHLRQRFQRILLVHCGDSVFDGLSQRTVLLLAENYGIQKTNGEIVLANLDAKSREGSSKTAKLSELVFTKVERNRTLVQLQAPDVARRLESTLRSRSDLRQLGQVVSIGIGYVTGANSFFQVNKTRKRELRLKAVHLSRVLPRAVDRWFPAFRAADWRMIRDSGLPSWVLTAKSLKDPSVRNMVQRGHRAGVHRGFKCRARDHWWKLSLKNAPPAFMTYMGESPSIVANSAGVLVSNSLYEIRNLKGISATSLAAVSMTSVFRLTALLNSRELGGGLRKLEPSDAKRILAPTVSVAANVVKRIARFVRLGQLKRARLFADKEILVGQLGWTSSFVLEIQEALAMLERTQEHLEVD